MVFHLPVHLHVFAGPKGPKGDQGDQGEPGIAVRTSETVSSRRAESESSGKKISFQYMHKRDTMT